MRRSLFVRGGGFDLRVAAARLASVVVLLAATAVLAGAQSLSINTGPNLGTWSIGQDQVPLVATGGTGSYSWSIVGGTPPDGMAIRTDMPPWFPPNASAGLIGVTTTPGTYSFTLQVSDGVSVATQTVFVRITPLAVQTPYNLPDAFVGTPYSVNLAAISPNGTTFSWTPNGTLPPGFSLSPDGVLFGTPSSTGGYPVSFSVTDGTDTLFWNLSVNVYAVQISTDGLLPAATLNQPYTAAIAASSGAGGVNVTISNLPAGLSQSGSTISGTPTQQGRFLVAVVATDAANNSYTKQMTLWVMPTPVMLPGVTPYGSQFNDCTIGVNCNLGVMTQFGGEPPFTYTASGLPGGMSIRWGSGVTSSWVQPGDAEIYGPPSATGFFNVTVTVTDAAGHTGSNTFALHVSALQMSDFFQTATVGTAYAQPLHVIGGRAPYNVTLTGGLLPHGLTLDSSTGTVSGTPQEGGAFFPQLTFTDANGHGLTQTMNLYVTSAGDPAVNLSISISGDSSLGVAALNFPYSFQLSACCTAVTWSLDGGTLPPGLSLTSGGLLSGTANTAGTYQFLIRATDASNAANYTRRWVTLAVSPVSITTAFTLPAGNQNTFYSQQLPAAGGSGSYIWSLAPGNALPPGLTLTSGGLLSGVPTATGQFQFRINVTDTFGNPAFAYFNLALYPLGQQPPVTIPMGGNFGTFSIGELQYALFATGGTGHYTWSVVSGSLPPGLSVRADGPAWFPATASAGVIGVATAPGVYNFTLRVTDGLTTADLPVTLTISALTFKDWNLPDAFQNVPYSYTLTPLNAPGSVTYSVTYGMPPGLSLNAATGEISGTPTTPGFYNIQVWATSNGGAAVFRDVNLGVYAIQLGTSTPLAGGQPDELPNATPNAPYTATLTASGGSGSYTFSVNSLPGGLSLDPHTGIISGTYTFGPGRASFSATVTDGNSVSYSHSFTIQAVATPAVLPAITAFDRLGDCTFGFICNRTVSVNDGAVAPYTWTATGLPNGLTIRPSITSPGDIDIWGTPVELGDFQITVTMTDATGAQVTSVFPLHISELELNAFLVSGTVNTPYSQTLRIIGGAPGYVATQVNSSPSSRFPLGLSLDSSTQIVSGTPIENGGFNPDVVFTDSASPDAHVLHLRTFISITSPGVSTLQINTNGDLGTWVAGQTLNTTAFACCLPSVVWSVVSGTPPTGLVLAPQTGGNAILSTTSPLVAGVYTFVLKVQNAIDPTNFAVHQFTLNVTPLALSGSTTLPFGNLSTPYSQQLSVSGATGSTTWTLSPYSVLPPGLTLSAGGLLSGTPLDTGQFSFNVTVVDGAGHTATYGFTLSIYPVGQTPPLSFNLQSSFVPQLGVFTFQLPQSLVSGGKGPYHFALAPGAPVVPGIRVQDGGPMPTNFPPSVTAGLLGVFEAAGSFSTTIRVTDSNGQFVDKAVTFNVNPMSFLTQSQPPKATVNTPYSFTPTVIGGVGTLTWTATGLPAGLAIDNTTGEINGSPTAAGTGPVSVTVADQAGHQLTVVLSLTINAFAINTDGALPTGTQNQFYSQQFGEQGCTGTCTWSAVSTPPAGLTLSGTGLLQGTPTGTFNGAFTVQLTNGTATVQKIFGLVIVPAAAQALSITSPTQQGPSTITANVFTTLTASGGLRPYAWSIANGALPPGLLLATDGSTVSASATPGFGLLYGRLAQTGTYTFTVQVTDAANNTATRTYTWIVSGLNFQYVSLPLTGTTLTRGSSYTQALLVIGGTSHYSWAGTPPAGLTLDPSTGVVTGTPLDSGTVFVPITVSDDGGRVLTNNVTFTIGGGATTLAFGANPVQGPFLEGQTFTINLSPTGGTAPYTVTAVSPLPPGFVLESGNAILAGNGTPGTSYFLAGTPSVAGSFSVTLQLQDSAAHVEERTFTITVSPIALLTNTGLLNGTSLPDGSVGAPYSEQLVAVDASGPIVWALNTPLPAGLTLSSSGLVSGTPTSAGTYSFQATITDVTSGGVVFTGNFSLKISPMAISSPGILPEATAGQPYSFFFGVSGAPGAVTWSATGLPGGLTLSTTTGELSGVALGGAISQITVTATSGGASATRRVTLFTRTNNLFPPTVSLLSTELADASVGQIYLVTLSPTGGLAPYTWSVAPGSSLPPGLSLVSGAQVPPNVFPGFTVILGQATVAGHYTFDLIVTDSVPTQTRRTYTLNVSPVGILSGTLRNATAGQPYAEQLTPFGGTPPYAFSLSAPASTPTQTTLPSGITLSSSGLLAGTTLLTGAYNFVVTVQDSSGATFARQYRFVVSNASGWFVSGVDPANASVGQGILQDLLTNGPSTYTWSLVGGALPPGVVLGVDPNDSITPAITGQATTAGTYSYTVRATDTANPSNTADHTFTLTVAPMQIESPAVMILSTVLPPAHVGVAYSTVIKVAGGTAPYTFAESPAAPLPPGLTLGADGTLSGTLTQNGNVTIQPIITDSAGATLYAGVGTLFVTEAGTPTPLTGTANTSLMGDASVGVPYKFALDVQLGGVAPFSWTVAPGSTLPPGLGIVSGSNGVPDYLTGAPTTAGSYAFSITVSDSSGQTLALPFMLNVSPIALTPNDIPPGQVNTPYSVSLIPSGGVGPYTIQARPDWGMPPGLTLSNGTLSGTPTSAGSWIVSVVVSDSASPADVLSELFEITIDNAAGQAPAIAFGQRSIQVAYVQGSPVPAPVSVPITTTTGTVAYTIAIEGIPGATVTGGSGTAPGSVSVDTHAATLPAGSYAGVLAANASGAANVNDAIPVLVNVLAPLPCGYALTPGSASAIAAGANGNFSLNTGATCAWTVTSGAPWITVTSAASGTGPTTVQYTVAANGGSAQRSGTIAAGGQSFTVTQFGSSCSFALSSLGLSAPATGGSASLDVTASDPSCAWTASGLSVSPASGTGSGTVVVTIPPNNAAGIQTLTATIAGQTFTVTESGIDCSVALSPLSAAFADAGGSGSFNVSTGAACGYATSSSPNWVTINAGGSGTGPGTLLYTVGSNSATTPRTGSIIIGGQSFSISQAAAQCSVTLDTSALNGPFGVAGGSVAIGVIANGSNCPWTASSPVNWASVAPAGASGNGSVTVSIAANTQVGARSTSLTIAGQTVAISQGGQACSYTLQASTGAAPASGGSGPIGVLTTPSCTWTAVSNTPSWLSVSPPGSTGAGSAQFTALANTDPSPRTGTLTIAGATFTVTQDGAQCTYTLPSTGATVAGEGATGQSFSLSGAAACSPQPVSYASWISIDQAAFTGGSGSITYSVQPNPLATPRTGVIQIADQTFTVTQTVAQSACQYSLHAYGAIFNKGGGGGDVFASAADTTCDPTSTIGTDQPSFITLGPLMGPSLDIFTEPYSVSPFTTPLIDVSRRATITFGGQVFVVKQVSW